MKFCHKCGAQCEDEAKFCKQCGAKLADVNTNQNQYTYEVPPQYTGTETNIAIAVILSIVTCGLYGIYWMIKLNDEINQICGDTHANSGGMVFLFTLITCGIYGLYWMYKMGEKCDQIKGVNGNSGILYLILGIFGLGIVNYCLMQDTINKAIS